MTKKTPVRLWNDFEPAVIFKQRKGKTWRFTTNWGKTLLEAFSSTGKIRNPDSKPKVKSQSWRIIKGGKK